MCCCICHRTGPEWYQSGGTIHHMTTSPRKANAQIQQNCDFTMFAGEGGLRRMVPSGGPSTQRPHHQQPHQLQLRARCCARDGPAATPGRLSHLSQSRTFPDVGMSTSPPKSHHPDCLAVPGCNHVSQRTSRLSRGQSASGRKLHRKRAPEAAW